MYKEEIQKLIKNNFMLCGNRLCGYIVMRETEPLYCNDLFQQISYLVSHNDKSIEIRIFDRHVKDEPGTDWNYYIEISYYVSAYIEEDAVEEWHEIQNEIYNTSIKWKKECKFCKDLADAEDMCEWNGGGYLFKVSLATKRNTANPKDNKWAHWGERKLKYCPECGRPVRQGEKDEYPHGTFSLM